MSRITLENAIALHQSGQVEEALNAYASFLEKPQEQNNAGLWFLHGGALSNLGRENEARHSFQKAVTIDPNNPDFILGYAQSLLRLNKNKEALEILLEASKLSPEIPPESQNDHNFNVTYSIARAYEKTNRHAKALEFYQKLPPTHCQSLLGAGSCLLALRRTEEAQNLFKTILKENPDNPQAILGMGLTYNLQRDYPQAQEHFKRAINIVPDFAEAYDALAFCSEKLHDYQSALMYSEKATQLAPQLPEILNTRANLLLATGNSQQAAALLQQAVNLDPDNPTYFSKLLLTLHYFDGVSPKELFLLHKKWAEFHTPKDCTEVNKKLRNVYLDNKNRDKIRVGFVSPDFCNHPVAFFLLPLLKELKSLGCEVFCYSNTTHEDETTNSIYDFCTGFYSIKSMSDIKSAELIASHGIDRLVDLAGHTPGNRLGIFYYKPSPVSFTYLGYPDTTGLDCIDYRIVDRITDPNPKIDESSLCSENVIYIKNCFLPCENVIQNISSTPRPYLKNGFITFGCFNNLAKLTEERIKLWAEILNKIPTSRLILKSSSLIATIVNDSIKTKFSAYSVDPNRITCLGKTPSHLEHLRQYSFIDIALDTHPYNGTTTTLEAIMMGVPVLCQTGNSHHSRVSASLLSYFGAEKLITNSSKNYLQTALDLATNHALLSEIVTEITQSIQKSRLSQNTKDIAATIYNPQPSKP